MSNDHSHILDTAAILHSGAVNVPMYVLTVSDTRESRLRLCSV